MICKFTDVKNFDTIWGGKKNNRDKNDQLCVSANVFKYDLRLQKRPVRRYKYIIYKFIWSSRNGGYTTTHGYRGAAMRKRFPSTI